MNGNPPAHRAGGFCVGTIYYNVGRGALPTPTGHDDRPVIIEGPAAKLPRHCEEGKARRGNPRPLQCEALAVLQRGRGRTDCHGPDGPRNDVVIWGWFFYISRDDEGHGCQFWRIGRAIHESPLRYNGSQMQKTKKERTPEGVRSGTPEGTRTPDLLIRSQSLYPTELPAHVQSRLPVYINTAIRKCQALFFKILKNFLSVDRGWSAW